uniref:Fur family transcriptional regulator n=1 Tax=Agathobacter sp. TaxID=2021311 RepID=UPI00405773B0
MIKRSRQREAIQLNLANRYDHPTAEMVYMDIKEQFPNISLGTVYRNLSLLSDLGEIQKISTGIGPDRFDGNAKPHCHFQCRACSCVSDISFENQEEITAVAAKGFPGIIEGSHIQFYGLCVNCMNTH